MPPRYEKKDLWGPVAAPGFYVVTTNGTLKKDGSLVMGKGAALQALERHSNLPAIAGREVYYHSTGIANTDHLYGFLPVIYPHEDTPGIGLFQVKWSFRNSASIELIKMSVSMLTQFLELRKGISVRMNFPGIGAGGLLRSVVEPYLYRLPQTVTVCFQEE